MIISISSQTFDLDGHVRISPLPGSIESEVSRRVNRVPTLDGGVAVNDGGFSDGDRDLAYTWRAVSRSHNDRVSRMLRLYPQVIVSNSDGVFIAAPESFSPGLDQSTIRLLVIRKLSA